MTPRAPAKLLTILESRSAVEYATWNAARPMLDRLRKGDGHPVLVLPGFTASDGSTLRLRALLRRLGYRTYGWKLGNNLGPTPQIVRGLEKLLLEISDKEGGAPVSIIGWSLGGVYARDLARRHPGLVRQVITLGSPIHMHAGDPSAASALWDRLEPLHDPEATARILSKAPLPVPTTAVYSRTDGVVHWKLCLEAKSETSESVEVFGSHCGLGFNPSVAIVVADRLARPIGQWRRFRPPLWAVGAFPKPTHWKPSRP